MWPAYFEGPLHVGLFRVFVPCLAFVQALLCARALLLRALPDGRVVLTLKVAPWQGARLGDYLLAYQAVIAMLQGSMSALNGFGGARVPYVVTMFASFLPECMGLWSSQTLSLLFASLIQRQETGGVLSSRVLSSRLSMATLAAVIFLSCVYLTLITLSGLVLINTRMLAWLGGPAVVIVGTVVVFPLTLRAHRAVRMLHAVSSQVNVLGRSASEASSYRSMVRRFTTSAIIICICEVVSLFVSKALTFVPFLYSPLGWTLYGGLVQLSVLGVGFAKLMAFSTPRPVGGGSSRESAHKPASVLT